VLGDERLLLGAVGRRSANGKKIRDGLIYMRVSVAGGLGVGFAGSLLHQQSPPLLGDLLGEAIIPRAGLSDLASALCP
jgi:hypothetical protein